MGRPLLVHRMLLQKIYENYILAIIYYKEQIFNVDEAGLNSKILPDKMLASKAEKEARCVKMFKDETV